MESDVIISFSRGNHHEEDIGRKFLPIRYNEPTNKDMAVILVFFNPTQSVRIIQNILIVKHFLDLANIPCFIGELSTNDTPFVFTPSERIFQYSSSSYMFYKENLIKAVEAKIPEHFTKLCMMDADIMFDNPYWYSIVSRQLDTCNVCQPFIKAHYLGISFRIENTRTNCVDSTCTKIQWGQEHSGYVWAFDREWYQSTNISDMTVVGGGDTFLINTLKDVRFDEAVLNIYRCIYKKQITTLSSCNLNIYHLNHGVVNKRQYVDRVVMMNTALNRMRIDTLSNALVRRDDGILEWKPEYKHELNKCMYRYFCFRDDDSISASESKSIKFYPPKYIRPVIKDMAIILVFFNPNPYNRIIQNILIVKHYLENAGIPYFIAELAFENKPFLFTSSANIFQFRSDSYMFYKENLIKSIEPFIPLCFKKLCIMDADIFYDKPNWYSIISNTLDRVVVTQPFKRCIWLTGDFREYRERANCIDSMGSQIDHTKEHPGFVWAFDREWFRHSKFVDISITIGGDTLLHDFIKDRNSRSPEFYRKHFTERMNTTGVTYDSCSLTVWHLNHGDLHNRQYVNIIDIMTDTIKKYKISKFNATIYRRPDNIFEWSTPFYKKLFNGIMQKYFADRLEDDIG